VAQNHQKTEGKIQGTRYGDGKVAGRGRGKELLESEEGPRTLFPQGGSSAGFH